MASDPLHLYDALPEVARRKAAVPRLARLLGNLAPARAKKLSEAATEAALYWEIYTYRTPDGSGDCGLLPDGLRAAGARRLAWRRDCDPTPDFLDHQIRRAAALLGAVAFEMLCQKPEPAFNGIRSGYDAFRDAVARRFIDAGAHVNYLGQPEPPEYFFDDWSSLLAMDSVGLRHLIFTSDHRDRELRFTDIDTLSFFAAYWAVNHATAVEQRMITRSWDHYWGQPHESFYNVWRFAAETPADVVVESKYYSLFGPLYDGTFRSGSGHAIRATELIYRSWTGMAGSDERRAFLREFRELERTNPIARKLTNGFIDLPQPGEPTELDGTIRYQMGTSDKEDSIGGVIDGVKDNPLHDVRLTPFRLHHACVTNAEYYLFDASHGWDHWLSGAFPHPLGKDDDYPVVNVTWYDAWCFAAWCGCCLPSEAQWEYACRAGTSSRFWSGDSPSDLARVARFGASTLDGHTFPVAESHTANPWGFHHMHGNVREWCVDWYLPSFYTTEAGLYLDPVNAVNSGVRVLRGGSWYNNEHFCRSADRGRVWPSDRDRTIGFRLAATPVQGAKKSSQRRQGVM